ncbi:FtsX-like permease family protein [Microbacterium sp. ASV81]|uniref:ABC3 transporter permease C-terminal domain-containing protein n=1 Tax=Microbacterium capsulatum TaxID=3041921 RepID=A0ABU0XFW2_9MICO|nr:FtsX-like permease family protein [Microbacterium sp. ASV81]MDQ4212585.1 hypothetical protein [Microbacterium sp. ASV81]
MTRALPAPGLGVVVARTMRTVPLLSAFLVLALAAMTLAGLLVPPLVDQARTATVQHQIDVIPEAGRPLAGAQAGMPVQEHTSAATADAWAAPLAAAAAARDAQPEPLRSALGTPRVVGTFGGTGLVGDRRTPANKVQLLMDPGLERRSRLVQGAYPQPTDPAQGVGVVMVDAAAKTLDWKVGESRRREGLTVTLTGLVAPDGTESADWTMMPGALEPIVELTPMGDRILDAVAFLAPGEAGLLGDMAGQTSTFSWIPLDAAAIDAGNVATVSRQLRLMMATAVHLGTPTGGFFDRGLIYATPVADALDRGVARGGSLTAVLAVAAVGPLAVAVVVLALAGRQLAMRRRRAAALLRARGASLVQLAVLFGGESLLLGLIGAAIGLLAGILAVRNGPDPLAVLIAALLVLVPVCTAPLTVLAGLRRAERGSGTVPLTARWRRAVIEIVIVALAVALGAVLRGRGAGDVAVDPLLLAVPLLVGGAGTVLVLRLLPPLLDALHRSSARRTGLIALLGPARALRDATLRTAPALAAVIGIAVAVFSLSFSATVSDGIARSARESTGADIAVTLPYSPDDQTAIARAVAGVRAVATLDADAIGQAASSTGTGRVRIYAVDRAAFVRVQQGFDGALPMPAELASPGGGAIPVVASAQLLDQFGDALTVNGRKVRIVARTAQAVPFGTAEKWVIVDRANLARIGVTSSSGSRLFVSVAHGHDPTVVARALGAALGAGTTTVTAGRIIADAASDPASAALTASLTAATGVVALLLAVAVVQTLVLGAAARARLLALLRAIGYPRRGELPLVAWEAGPGMLVSLPVGVAAGAATAWLVVGGLDLRGFTGGQAPPELTFGGAALLAVVAGFLLVTALAVLLSATAAAQLRSADAIRVADDEG